MPEPYRPNQRAIVFQDEQASGDVLGYHCTIVRVRTRSVRRHPDRPDRWVYKVYVPVERTHKDVESRHLFVTGGIDPPEWSEEEAAIEPICEFRFDSEIADDNDEIRGAYRVPGCQWERFLFRKGDQPVPDYQLRVPVGGFQVGAGNLCYNVPATDRLNRRYVLAALAEIVGVKAWQPD